MKYHHALNKASILRAQLAPHCERIVVAGSIRRMKEEIKDIELVAIPKLQGSGLFCDNPIHCEGFGRTVLQHRILKGDPWTGKFIQFELADGTHVDLFTTTAAQWGYILTLRTGSAEHNIKLVQRLKANGYTLGDGLVRWKGEPLQLPTEEEVFRRAGLRYVEPQFRAA